MQYAIDKEDLLWVVTCGLSHLKLVSERIFNLSNRSNKPPMQWGKLKDILLKELPSGTEFFM